jgi:hypothetical protein
VKGPQRTLLIFSKLFPFDPPGSLVSFVAPKVEGSAMLLSPVDYARVFLLLTSAAVVGGAASLIFLGRPLAYFVAMACVTAAACPLFVPSIVAQGRRRSADGELPFFAMLLFILSHESNASLVTSFEKAEQLGRGIFPALSQESARLRRNIAYSNESEQSAIEGTFRNHPSAPLRELVHGYQTALSSGRDVHEFVREEAERLLETKDEKWRNFSASISSLTEVSFIFLAIFPIGIQMVAGGFTGGQSSPLLAFSTLLLTVIAVGLLMWMDSAQPVTRDVTLPAAHLAGLVAACCAILAAYYLGIVGVSEAAGALLAVSAVYLYSSSGFFRNLRSGEEEAAGMLHDLAELTRSGVELPRALPALLEDQDSLRSLREPLAIFSFQLSLGKTPVEAQRAISHPSWLVRISFALLAVAFETGGGFEQLERLSSSLRRVTDSRASAKASVLPYAALGVAVPALSAASFWFLRSMLALSPGFQLFSMRIAGTSAGGSILACTILTGFLVSKAYSQTVRNASGLPPLLASALLSLLLFGSP